MPDPLPSVRKIRSTDQSSWEALGKSVMQAVSSDMQRTQVPSWIKKPPIDWGQARRGKLSANNWEVICTIHLVFTLIRLWGVRASSERKRAMLRNYMDLIQAVRILTMKSIAPTDSRAYQQRIHRHLVEFKELYPNAKINSIHHAALHADEKLTEFGPIPARNAGHYERSIYFMQELNTNNKFGEFSILLHLHFLLKGSMKVNWKRRY